MTINRIVKGGQALRIRFEDKKVRRQIFYARAEKIRICIKTPREMIGNDRIYLFA
jgi:hypothetical protein